MGLHTLLKGMGVGLPESREGPVILRPPGHLFGSPGHPSWDLPPHGLKLALGVGGTVAGYRLGALEGGGDPPLPSNASLPPGMRVWGRGGGVVWGGQALVKGPPPPWPTPIQAPHPPTPPHQTTFFSEKQSLHLTGLGMGGGFEGHKLVSGLC